MEPMIALNLNEAELIEILRCLRLAMAQGVGDDETRAIERRLLESAVTLRVQNAVDLTPKKTGTNRC